MLRLIAALNEKALTKTETSLPSYMSGQTGVVEQICQHLNFARHKPRAKIVSVNY